MSSVDIILLVTGTQKVTANIGLVRDKWTENSVVYICHRNKLKQVRLPQHPIGQLNVNA